MSGARGLESLEIVRGTRYLGPTKVAKGRAALFGEWSGLFLSGPGCRETANRLNGGGLRELGGCSIGLCGWRWAYLRPLYSLIPRLWSRPPPLT